MFKEGRIENSIENYREKEPNERFGKNVKIRVTFMRHATKADTSDITGKSLLSEKGQEEAREKGRRLETKEDGIKSYTSPVARAIETANLVIEEQEKKGAKIFKVRERCELDLLPGSKDFYEKIIELTKENLPADYSELEGDKKQEAFEKAEDVALDWWLQQEDEKFDEETISPKEMAVSIAKLVDKYIRMSSRLYSGSSVDLLNVSHKGTFEPFLKEVLLRKVKDEDGNEKVIRGFNSLEEIGGALRPAESWDLDIKTDETNGKSVKFNFREQEYDLDMQRLNELVAGK